jgi:peptidoglycan hydrolase-like protein with peptidoglycan-binding domain
MSKELTSISNFYKSFSGTDTLVFILMPGSNPVVLGSLTTISYSVYRNKKPVLNLGRTNINGVTRGSRIYAGTMIFTLINQHWINELKEQDKLDWLNEYDEIKADELPLFDLMIVSANEYGSYVSMFIYGVDLTDEAQVISIEDLFTENTFSFVARDISNFKAGQSFNKLSSRNPKKSIVSALASSRIYVFDSSGATLDDIEKIEKEMVKIQVDNKANVERQQALQTPARELEYSTSNMMIGNDVVYVQSLLNGTRMFELNINGIYDKDTESAVKAYQSSVGLDVNGKIDQWTFLSLLESSNIEETGNPVGIIINRSGAYVYQWANMESDIVDVRPYKDQIEINDLVYKQMSPDNADGGTVDPGDSTYSQKFYKTPVGYILSDDMLSYKYANSTVEFPIIKLNDVGAYITMLQSSLIKIYGEYPHENGTYDEGTKNKVIELQTENGLDPTGIVDNNTWLVLQNLTGDVINGYQDPDFKVSFNNIPGTYTIQNVNLSSDLMAGFNVEILSSKAVNVKCTAICYYKDSSKVISNNYLAQNNTIINFSDFEKAFLYDPSKGIPNRIEYIVYPFNKESYKWTINYTV